MRLLATKIFHLFYKGNMSAIYNSKVELFRVKRRNRQKRNQRSSLLFGGRTPISSKDVLKKSCWRNLHVGRVVVWCGVNQMIIHFSEASILPSVRSSINTFFYIILVLDL